MLKNYKKYFFLIAIMMAFLPLKLISERFTKELLRSFTIETQYENNLVSNQNQYVVEFSIFDNQSVLEKWLEIDVYHAEFLKTGVNVLDNYAYLNFSLVNFNNNYNSHYIDDGYNNIVHSTNFKLLEFNRNTTFSNVHNWINIGKGIGYDFLKVNNKILVAEIFGNVGYSSLSLNNRIFDLSNDKWISGVDLSAGLKLYYHDFHWNISLSTNYEAILNRSDFFVNENNIQIEWIIFPYILQSSRCGETSEHELGFFGGVYQTQKLMSLVTEFGYNNYYFNDDNFNSMILRISLKANILSLYYGW